MDFNAAEPEVVANFWRQTIGYAEQDPPQGYATWHAFLDANGIEDASDVAAIVDPDGVRPRIYIQRAPEPKVVENRLHIGISVPRAREASGEGRMVPSKLKRSDWLGLGLEYRDGQYGDCH